MTNQKQWNRGFEDPHKNQEYLESIRTRFDEFKNLTDDELIKILNKDIIERNKYNHQELETPEDLNPNEVNIIHSITPEKWWKIKEFANSNQGDIPHT